MTSCWKDPRMRKRHLENFVNQFASSQFKLQLSDAEYTMQMQQIFAPSYKCLEIYRVENVVSKVDGKMKPRLIHPDGKELIPVEEVFDVIERAHLENGHQKAFTTLWRGIKDEFPHGNISESMAKYFVGICEVCNQKEKDGAIPAAEPNPPTPNIHQTPTIASSSQEKMPQRPSFQQYAMDRENRKAAAATRGVAPTPISSASIPGQAIDNPTKGFWMPTFKPMSTSTPLVPNPQKQHPAKPTLKLSAKKAPQNGQQPGASTSQFKQDLREFVRRSDSLHIDDPSDTFVQFCLDSEPRPNSKFQAIIDEDTPRPPPRQSAKANSQQQNDGGNKYPANGSKWPPRRPSATPILQQQNVSTSTLDLTPVAEMLANTELGEYEHLQILLTDPQFQQVLVNLAEEKHASWALRKSEKTGKYFFYNMVKKDKDGKPISEWTVPDEWVEELVKRLPQRAEEIAEMFNEEDSTTDGEYEGEEEENANGNGSMVKEEPIEEAEESTNSGQHLQLEPTVQQGNERQQEMMVSPPSSLTSEPIQPNDNNDNAEAAEQLAMNEDEQPQEEGSFYRPFNSTNEALGVLGLLPNNNNETSEIVVQQNDTIVLEQDKENNVAGTSSNEQPEPELDDDSRYSLANILDNFEDGLGNEQPPNPNSVSMLVGVIRSEVEGYQAEQDGEDDGQPAHEQTLAGNFTNLDVPFDEQDEPIDVDGIEPTVQNHQIPLAPQKMNNGQQNHHQNAPPIIEMATERDAQNAAKAAQLLANLQPAAPFPIVPITPKDLAPIPKSMEKVFAKPTAKKTAGKNDYAVAVPVPPTPKEQEKKLGPVLKFLPMSTVRIFLPELGQIIKKIESDQPENILSALKDTEKWQLARFESSSDGEDDPNMPSSSNAVGKKKKKHKANKRTPTMKPKQEINLMPFNESTKLEDVTDSDYYRYRRSSIRSGRRSNPSTKSVIKLDNDEEEEEDQLICHHCFVTFNRQDYRFHLLFRHKIVVADSPELIEFLKQQRMEFINELDFYCETCGATFEKASAGDTKISALDAKSSAWVAHLIDHLEPEERADYVNEMGNILHEIATKGQNPFLKLKKEEAVTLELDGEKNDEDVAFVPYKNEKKSSAGKKRKSSSARGSGGGGGHRRQVKKELLLTVSKRSEDEVFVDVDNGEKEANENGANEEQNGSIDPSLIPSTSGTSVSNQQNNVVIVSKSNQSNVIYDDSDDDEDEDGFGFYGHGSGHNKRMKTNAGAAVNTTLRMFNCRYCTFTSESQATIEQHMTALHLEEIVASSKRHARGRGNH